MKEHDSILQRAIRYDQKIIGATTAIAGDEYATLTALIHRQVMGATILTWNEQRQRVDGWMKEQSTDGDLSTVDVIFPASPFYIYLAPEALRVMLLPVLDYANNATYIKYNRPFAPHHLGLWPVGDIRTEDQEEMQMEETGNMLIMLAAIAQQQDGKIHYLNSYRSLLLTWATYLNASLPDPMDQTCTDDFEGHIPHNANLAIKVQGSKLRKLSHSFFGVSNVFTGFSSCSLMKCIRTTLSKVVDLVHKITLSLIIPITVGVCDRLLEA